MDGCWKETSDMYTSELTFCEFYHKNIQINMLLLIRNAEVACYTCICKKNYEAGVLAI